MRYDNENMHVTAADIVKIFDFEKKKWKKKKFLILEKKKIFGPKRT